MNELLAGGATWGHLMKINLNQTVKVRLNDYGKQAHAENCVKLSARIGARKPDVGGWTTWQLWELMEEFGPHIHIGMTIPFVDNEILVEPANV